MTYGTANVSAVFEKLNEGEYVITGLNGSEENIVARGGKKVTIPLLGINPQIDFDVHYESDSSKKIEYEVDSTQKTISFIMYHNHQKSQYVFFITVVFLTEFLEESSSLLLSASAAKLH